jgi:Uma2 family endonuclease
MPDDGRRYELIEGELRMMSPAGGRHCDIAFNLATMLGNHIRGQQLGKGYTADPGFLLSRNPDTVRAPDVAFVQQSRLAQLADETGFLPIAPDFVAEVISPHDAPREVEEKARAWLQAGSRLVIVVDPRYRTLRVYRPHQEVALLHESSPFDAGDVIPGWTFRVGELFD